MVLNVAAGGPETPESWDPEATAEALGSLASPRRLEIVRLLARGDQAVTEVAHRLGLSVANTSHHLADLRRAGLVASRRQGTRVIYRLLPDQLVDLCRILAEVARRSGATSPV